MKLLRAKEQAQGIMPESICVRVPMLGLEKRVVVTDSGDPEFNGIYHCTGCNGNGFIFSKPRFHDKYLNTNDHNGLGNVALLEQLHDGVHPRRRRRVEEIQHNNSMTVSEDEEMFPPASPECSLRCIICKKFSNQTLLWYMSKEVQTKDGDIKQVFSFGQG
jgi:hypothetical protein